VKVRRRQVELGEEDVGELGVVVLACVDEDVFVAVAENA